MNLFVGLDWGQKSDFVCVVDEGGQIVAQRSFAHTVAGLKELAGWLLGLRKKHQAAMSVALERPDGVLVETLLDAGLPVFSINPKQLDRYRDRHSMAGAKDDRRDAFVAADALRTDGHRCQQVRLHDDALIELRGLVRADEDLRVEEGALSNRLRAELGRYFLPALELIVDRPDPFLWSLLKRAPTPERARKLTVRQIGVILKKHRITRFTATQVRAVLQSPLLPLAQGTVAAAKRHVEMLIPRIRLVHEQRREVAKQMDAILDQLQEPLESDPEGKKEHRSAGACRRSASGPRSFFPCQESEQSLPPRCSPRPPRPSRAADSPRCVA